MGWEESDKNHLRPQSVILSLWSALPAPVTPFCGTGAICFFSQTRGPTIRSVRGEMVMGETFGENFGERRKMTGQSSLPAARGSPLCSDRNTERAESWKFGGERRFFWTHGWELKLPLKIIETPILTLCQLRWCYHHFHQEQQHWELAADDSAAPVTSLVRSH